MTTESTIRRHRRKELLEQMKFAAALACDSHKHSNRRHIEQVFVCAVKLLRISATHEKMKELQELLMAASEQAATIETDGKWIHIHGTFAIDEIDKAMVWGSGVEYKEIGS